MDSALWFAAGFLTGLPAAIFFVDWAIARYLIQVAQGGDGIRDITVVVKGEHVEDVAAAVRRELVRIGRRSPLGIM